MASASGDGAVQPQSLTGLASVEEYIRRHHMPGVSWHATPNNHASTRPKACGGSLVRSVRECKTFHPRAGGGWQCSVDLPNSFAPGDGRQLHGVGVGGTQDEASETACRHAMAQLLLLDDSQVVLLPKHWAKRLPRTRMVMLLEKINILLQKPLLAAALVDRVTADEGEGHHGVVNVSIIGMMFTLALAFLVHAFVVWSFSPRRGIGSQSPQEDRQPRGVLRSVATQTPTTYKRNWAQPRMHQLPDGVDGAFIGDFAELAK